MADLADLSDSPIDSPTDTPTSPPAGAPTDTAGAGAQPELVDFPLRRTCPFAPPPEYQRFRQEGPVVRIELPSGQQPWLVTRHQEVRALLADPRFSSNRFNPGFPAVFGSSRPQPGRFKPSLIAMDYPEHNPARRRVVGEFTVRRIEAMRPRIQQIVDERIDAMLAGPTPADLVAALSLPVPSLVICELLGVPYSDHEYFQARSATVLNRTLPQETKRAAIDELQDYLDALVTEKEHQPTDDLIGRQIRARREAGDYRHDDVVALTVLLLIAGHETTANMISLGTVVLLENPDQLAIIAADPSRTPAAVEELLRYFTIAEVATSRVALTDVELGGVTIKAGDGVLVLSNSANHDESVFTDPDTLDLLRGARNHVAFGFGPHQCLGQNLARLELRTVFDTLFRRVPGLRLAAPVEELKFKDNAAIYGLHELPVIW
ncbi:MAG TPA: cytochrome P450 [Pseudonocardiaceae bacterium]